jgi:hypothetical protein
MNKPFGAVRIEPDDLSITELKTYLKVLQDPTTWNAALKYYISINEVVPEQEIEKVKELIRRY